MIQYFIGDKRRIVINVRKLFLDENKDPSVISELQRYYMIRDIQEGYVSHYLGIFNSLYVLTEKLNFDEISYKFSINRKTLYKYRIEFNSVAEEISNRIQQGIFCPIQSDKRLLQLIQILKTRFNIFHLTLHILKP